MQFETLGDWSKWLEKNFSPEVMIPTLPVILRVDGVGFSKWTSKLNKPFDEGLNQLMIETTKFLAKETNALISYHQSDEITLILYSSDRSSAIYHDGKKQKILSKLTSKLANFFNTNRPKYLPNHNLIADFDCRIYQTPTLEDACAQLLWRENDATRNSISMVAQKEFSHSRLQNLNTDEMQELLFQEKGINWNDLPTKYKRGTYIRRVTTSKPFTIEELKDLPAKHAAHLNPDLVIERSVFSVVDMPIFNKIKNKVDVVFNGAEPQLFEVNV